MPTDALPRTALAGAALLVGLVVLHGASAVAAPATPKASDDALASVQQSIGDAACERDDQCHTIAIGQKSCGGPEAYLAWSDSVTDGKALERLVGRYNAGQTSARLGDGRVSNCLFVTDPGALCVAVSDQQASGATAKQRSCQLRRSTGRAAPLPAR